MGDISDTLSDGGANLDDEPPRRTVRRRKVESKPEPELTWRQLRPPQPWHPEVGDEIVGIFMGTSLRRGRHGEYTVAMVSVPAEDGHRDPYLVSGAMVIQALHGANVSPGTTVRIRFDGHRELPNGYRMKMLVVFVAEMDPAYAATWLRDQVGK